MSLADEAVGEWSDGDPAPAQQGGESLKRLLDIVSTVGGYTAVLTALMLYFGYLRTRELFGYFGVPLGVLQLSTTDYLLRVPDVFFRPVVWSTLGLALLVLLSAGVEVIDRKGSKIFSTAVKTVLALATALAIALGILGLVVNIDARVCAVSLVVGGALIVIQYRFYRRNGVIRPFVIVPLIGSLFATAAAFWWVSVYAVDVGKQSAASIAYSQTALSDAVICSRTDLQLPTHQEGQPSPGEPKSCAFRFSGYRVLFYANARWFLIQKVKDWNPESPTVILRDDDSVHVELSQGR